MNHNPEYPTQDTEEVTSIGIVVEEEGEETGNLLSADHPVFLPPGVREVMRAMTHGSACLLQAHVAGEGEAHSFRLYYEVENDEVVAVGLYDDVDEVDEDLLEELDAELAEDVRARSTEFAESLAAAHGIEASDLADAVADVVAAMIIDIAVDDDEEDEDEKDD